MRASAVRVTGVICDCASGAGSPTVTVVPPTAVAENAVSKARACPTHSMTIGAPGPRAVRGVHLGGAEFFRSNEFVRIRIDADHTRSLDRQCRDESGHADSAQTDDHDLVVGSGRPALRTTPPPVSTAQPSTAAMDAGTSSATGTTDARLSTACEPNTDAPR